jgi:hypothetical protein
MFNCLGEPELSQVFQTVVGGLKFKQAFEVLNESWQIMALKRSRMAYVFELYCHMREMLNEGAVCDKVIHRVIHSGT